MSDALLLDQVPGTRGHLTLSTLDNLLEINAAFDAVSARQRRPDYERKLLEAARIYERALNGSRRDLMMFEEALGTADFPTYFGDVLDRQVLARFQEWTPNFELWLKTGTFNDLTRTTRRTQWRGGNQPLNQVGEFGPYGERGVSSVDYSWKGAKYGGDMGISWETMLADDLQQLRDFPSLLASAARVTECRFATGLYVDANGPHASLYTSGNGNVGTAALSITSLEAGITAMLKLTDPVTLQPIQNRPRYLVVPPALELTAMKIVKSMTLAYAATAGSAVPLPVENVVASYGLEVQVDPFIPVIAASANGSTSWFLFSDPKSGPLGPGIAAAEFDRLRGMDRPLLLQRRAVFQQVGGGDDPRGPMSEVDAVDYRLVHAMGGGQLFPQATYGSNGTT